MSTFTDTIDFDSPIPYYLQLIKLLKEKITASDWKSGDQLPSEPEMCERFSVSRTVVRQALQEIELEGLIVRRKGKGTFVAEPKINENLAQKLTGFYQDMVELGKRPVTQVLRQEIISAPSHVAQYLHQAPGTPVIVLQRLRFVDNEPIVLVTSYLPYTLCPQLATEDLTDQSLYAVLEKKYGLRIARGRRYIEAVAANETEASLLHIEEGAPLISLDSVSFLDNGAPVEYYHAVHRGDRSRFEVELVRVRETPPPHPIAADPTIQLPPGN